MSELDLPDLETTIGLYGNATRQEVGGPPCLAVVIGIIVSN